jgi:hypothetical protein
MLMDPILFGMDADVVGEVLGTIIVLSLFVERFLAPFFEWRTVIVKIEGKGVKEPVAFIASLLVAYTYGFDAMAIMFKEEANSWLGYILTAGIIAGGSKGSIKLFRDYLGWKSSARSELEESRKEAAKGSSDAPKDNQQKPQEGSEPKKT